MKPSIEGLFDSSEDKTEEEFKKLVALNSAVALIGIARGRIEGITANAFSDGKVTLPLINVYDYYKDAIKAAKEAK